MIKWPRWNENVLTYEDFEIGQKVIFTGWHEECESGNFDDHFTIGEKYKITDLDFHFPFKICVTGDRNRSFGRYRGFYEIKNFNYKPLLREKKINQILDEQ